MIQTGAGLELRPAANLASDPHRRFELDPQVLLAAELAGLTVVAHYHSHPDAPAALSAEDRRQMTFEGQPVWPGVDQWIVSVYKRRPTALTRWRWCPRRRDFARLDLERL